jgi:hypothetical protein
VVASTTAGQTLISPAALNWNVANPEICTIEDGIVKALKNGKTTVTGQINDITDQVQIHVMIPATPTIIGDSMKTSSWTLNASSFLNAQLNQTNLPAAWDHGAAVNFVHAAGRSPFIKLINQRSFFGLPDTIKILMNMGDMSITRALVYLRSNNATKTTSYEVTNFQQNKDFTLNIPVNNIFDATDKAIYPVWFDNINFYIETSGMTESKAYTLAVKDILLVYKNFVISGVSPVKSNSFNIFPNPVTNQTLYLQLKNNQNQTVRTEVYNTSGQLLVSNQHGRYKGGNISVSLKNLKSGLYLIKVYENDQFSVAKFSID